MEGAPSFIGGDLGFRVDKLQSADRIKSKCACTCGLLTLHTDGKEERRQYKREHGERQAFRIMMEQLGLKHASHFPVP